MSKLKWALGVALVAIVLATGFFWARTGSVFGAISPSDLGVTSFTELAISNGISIISGGLTENGGILRTSVISTTTTATAQTLIASDVQGYDTVILTPTVGPDTVTFFASSTATTFLPTAGYAQDTCFVNGTTTANQYILFAGGTGTVVQVASSSATALGSLKLDPQKTACFHFTRGNATPTTFDIMASLTVYK